MKIECSPVYLDTSALAKLYVSEPDSEALEAALLGRRDLLVSDLAATELTSAIGRRLRAGDLSNADAGAVYQTLLRDLDEGQYRWLTLAPGVYRQAEQLLLSANRLSLLRAADALHVACALAAGARGIVTFDRRMGDAIEELGALAVQPER